MTDDKQGLKVLKLKAEYNTDEDDIIRDLYSPCLLLSLNYDRAVGYFRANIYRELGEDLLNFIIKGGNVRIVCSPDIPELDEQAARDGYNLRGKRAVSEVNVNLLAVLETMSKNPAEEDCLNMLRLIIERGSLELFIAVRPSGIYHRKIGRFTDGYGNRVVFSGSGNETSRAITSFEDWANDEDFDVYRNWGEDFETRKASKKDEHLDALFLGGTKRTKVRPLNEIEKEYLNKFRLHKNLEDCRPGARARNPSFQSSTILPYYYQNQAINAWKISGKKGILSMATSTGKTITALLAIREIVEEGYPVLVVVPSRILLKQWSDEISPIFGTIPLMRAGGGFSWKTNETKNIFVSKIKKPRIIIATMDTAATDSFLEFFRQADEPILVADEVHAIGSPKHRRLLEIPFLYKLGLSATPERLFDEEGNQALHDAFGEKPVYQLSIGDSVKLNEQDLKPTPILGHFLSNYNYFFETISLTTEEQQVWDDLTQRIRKIAAIANSRQEDLTQNKQLNSLLIQRARIAKKAENKVRIVSDIIDKQYPANGKWIVYCEDEEQLDDVIEELRRLQKGSVILKYHSKLSDEERARTIEYFEHNSSILVSIRCLDEGVNIPSINGAIILASSTNPRQYIQRRGRVLRKAKNKGQATIIDVIVTPGMSEKEIPCSIIRSELARAWSFAQNADNKEILHKLWELCFKYEVNPEIDATLGIEMEEEE